MPKSVVEASAMGSATLIVKVTRLGQEGGARQVEGLLCLSVSARAAGVCRSVRVRIYEGACAGKPGLLHKQKGRGVRETRSASGRSGVHTETPWNFFVHSACTGLFFF